MVIGHEFEGVYQYFNLTLIPEEAHNKAQLVREKLVVGIEKADQGAECCVNPDISCRGMTAILLQVDYSNAWIADGFNSFCSAIGRRVVNNNGFEILKVLLQQRC